MMVGLVWIGTVVFLLTYAAASAGAYGPQTFSSGRAMVAGSVVTTDAGDVVGVRVQLQPLVSGPVLIVYTDSFGHFSFQDVPPGNYAIVISVPGYHMVNRQVEVGEGSAFGLEFMLTPLNSGKAFSNGSTTVSVRQMLIPGKARKEFNKAVSSQEHGKTDDAIEHWQKSIKIFPQYAESYMQLSKVYANRGDFARATEAAIRAIGIDGKSADPYEFLGYVYLKEKDFPKARDAFANAVKLSDSDWFSQFWLGQLLLDERDAQGAYPHLRLASQLNPQIPEIEIALYDDLLMLDRPKEALVEIDDFLARFPNSPLAAKARVQRNQLARSLDGKQH
ncbi:MAG: tetratricopeptide repeat protein [Acidobacteriota bacterium]|nr:tetratricopeptide repeat protein [Acidobacteriota bacterium]